jgi:hypothetical protein
MERNGAGRAHDESGTRVGRERQQKEDDQGLPHGTLSVVRREAGFNGPFGPSGERREHA